MTGNRVDAATSTEDIKGRPLCLFYFTHPFGVLSPDPPTITTAPADITHAFINMEPAPYNLWGSSTDDSYKTTSSSSDKPKVSYELGHTSISRKPLNVLTYSSKLRSYQTVDLDSNYVRNESISSLFSSEYSQPLWSHSSSSKNDSKEKRIPFPCTLPPLQIPLREVQCCPPERSCWEQKRPKKKLSLPPIELPLKEITASKVRSGIRRRKIQEVFFDKTEMSEFKNVKRFLSRNGVSKSTKRPKRSGLRRMVTQLIQRVTKGFKEHTGSPAIQEVLHTIREAWAEPKSLQDRSRTVTSENSARTAILEDSTVMLDQRQLLADAFSPRPGASPGLMRRRYSMPETIMRKYRLAQLRSDSDDSEPATAPSRAASPASLSPARGSCASLCEPAANRFIRRDRELMRKSALLRRLWGGPKQPLSGSNNELAPCACSCDPRYCSDKDLYDSHTEYGRESKSLDGSHTELRHASGGHPRASRARDSHPPAGWATPKRQRLDSPSGLNSSDEMLRTAMRNSYDRAEVHRNERGKREETTSDSTFQSHGREVSSVTTSDGSLLTETPESAEAVKPRKRRQSVCIYMNSLESPNAEIKSETVTATPDDTVSLSISQPRTAEHTELSNSTFATTEVTSTNLYSDSTGRFDTASTNDVQYRDSLDTHTASTNEKYVDQKFNGVIQGDSENNESADKVTCIDKSPMKLTESITEILEIVVSETLNSTAFVETKGVPAIECNSHNTLNVPKQSKCHVIKQKQHMDLDEYVSNILVESLNSLTDQIEEMNASMGGDSKISIVEKEIKVKLQNTGMNTIVHLSPNSNNPIIFGNEELFNKFEVTENDEKHYKRNDNIDKSAINIEITDNNDLRLTDCLETNTHCSPKSPQFDKETPSITSTENINQAVLQQIQKLFQDGMEIFDPKINYPGRMVPEISHIEISNVDVFIDDNSDPNYDSNDKIEINTDRNSTFNCTSTNNSLADSILGEVGTGTYFPEQPGSALVPRFSAFPNTDSMEVNTSSSDDAELLESDCTSLVDSLDDPKSPRSVILRQAYSNRRSELVRSAIDVLDLLPDMAYDHSNGKNQEKSEAFFIRIRENDCDCEKENVVVADHMPDIIKQRLYRRHRKRELRMEYAKRKKVRQIKRDIEKQRQPEIMKSKREIEKDCTIILKSLIDEVVSKIAEEEHKYMRIKQKKNPKKTEETLSTSANKKPKSNKKGSDLSNLESFKITKNGEVHFCNSENAEKVKKTKTNENTCNKTSNLTQVRGKLSLQTHSPVTPDDYGPKRVYHKSEIHDGNKCIEILEILEYVESSHSSPESTNSDDNLKMKSRKSRIPIPIYERIHRIPRVKNIGNPYKNSSFSSPNLNVSENIGHFKMDALIANIFIDALNDNAKDESSETQQVPTRRASVPQQDTHRGRSTSSLRFKQMFDIIPEEKSSLSVESSNEDINLNRRISAPVLTSKYPEANNNDTGRQSDKVTVKTSSKYKNSTIQKSSKSTSTSPLSEEKLKIRSIPTSPLLKSAATSPIILPNVHENGIDDKIKNASRHTNTGKKSLSSHGTRDGWVGFYKPNKQLLEEEGIRYNSKEDLPKESGVKDQKSANTQYEHRPQSTVRTIETEKTKHIIINHDKTREKQQFYEPKHRVEDTQKPSLNNKEPQRKKDKNKTDLFDKFKDKDAKSKRETRLVHSMSDPQSRTDLVIKKTDKKKIQMISVEKSKNETTHSKALKLPAFTDKQIERSAHSTSDSDSDSAKSLLCSLAPKWLSMGSGVRQKRQTRKKASQELPNQTTTGGWSVTVAGNCYTALPADVEMRLSFPKPPAHQVASQSDSGFGEDNRIRRPIAEAQKALGEKSCQCRHCEDCTCPRNRTLDESYSSFLPPAHNRKMTLMMKKESSGSSIHACKSLKKPNDSLPDVDTYRSSKSKSKNTVKMPRRLSLHCWLPDGDDLPRRRTNDCLAVTGCAIIPEAKPRVPTMSERDLTRVYTPRHYLRS